MWGAIIGAGASLIGGALNRKSQKDQYKRERNDAISDQINKLPRLRESAEKAGFNPLTALMSTGGGGFGQTGVSMGVAPLSSAAILTNAVSGIADAWTDKRADDAHRAKVEGEIWRRQIEKERAGGAGETIRRTARRAGVADLGARPATVAAGPTSGNTPALGAGPWDLWSVAPSLGPAGAPELAYDENVRREHIGALEQSVTRADGSIVTVPVGPDLEEIAAGAMIKHGPEIYASQKQKWDNWSEWAPIRLGIETFTAAKKADSFIRYLGGNLIASPNSDGRMTEKERRDMMKKYRGNTGVYNKGNY